MMSSNFQETDDASQVKQENDWEVVDYGPGEQEAVSDPVNDPLNYVGPNSTCNAEKDIPAIPVLKNEIPEQENDTVSAYFMSEVTDDTTIEEGGNDNEETETIIVAPEWSWEAMNETSDDSDNNTEAHDNSTRKDVFIGIDNNGILPSDSESVDNDDDDDDDYRVKSKKKKRKKSPDKNKSVKFAEDNYESLITSVKRKKYKKSPDMNKVEKIKLRDSEYAKHGSNKLEILNNPEDIYIPDGWSRRVFQRLSGKYPGKLDVLYIDPNGKKFKSKIDIIRYFCENNIKSEVDVKAMCFGYGRPGFLPVFPEGYKAPEKSSITKAPPKSNNLPPKSNNLPPKSNNLPLVKTQKTTEKRSKISNQEKYKKEISSHISEVSTICERLSVKDVTVEYSKEDFVNLTNHQVYTEYISAMLEAENPEVPASDISEIAEAKWKHFLVVKESKTATKEDKVSQELIEFLQEDDYEEPEDERDEDYKDDDAESNDSHGSDYATNPRKIERPFPCNSCSNAYTSMKSLKRHFREKDHGNEIENKYFSCIFCSQECPTLDNLRIHLGIHGINAQGKLKKRIKIIENKKKEEESPKDKTLICTICNETFAKLTSFRDHVNDVHYKKDPGQKSYHCNLCEYVAHRKDAMDVHMRRHTGERPYQCPHCEYSAISRTAAIMHTRIHEKDKRYKCDFCDYSCVQAGSLKVHMRTHNDDKPYMCSICGHRCITNGNLKLHMQKHSDKKLKEYECSFCESTFSQKSSLNLHMKKFHNDDSSCWDKNFLCTTCGHTSSSAANLQSHMKIHTGEKTHKCSVCERTFTQKGALSVHMRKHTGEKPYHCNFCEYKCTTSGNLKKHQLLKHNKSRTSNKDKDSDYEDEFYLTACSYQFKEEKNDNDTEKNIVESSLLEHIQQVEKVENIDSSLLEHIQQVEKDENITA